MSAWRIGARARIILFLALFLAGCGPEFRRLSEAVIETGFRMELAQRWAPVHYQHVSVYGEYSLGGRSDYLAAVNFDGDWNTTNNWDNAERYPLIPVVYYSLVA